MANTSPYNPAKYRGIFDNLCISIVQPRAPTTADVKDPRVGRYYQQNTVWLDSSADQPYLLAKIENNQGIWVAFGTPGPSTLQSLTGDTGGTVTPDGAANINILGDSAQGVSTVGDDPTHQIEITVQNASTTVKGVAQFNSSDFIVAAGIVSLSGSAATDTYQSDSGTASPSGGILNVLGGEGIDTSATGNTLTIAGEDATAAATSGAANKGICSFNSADFTVASGYVSLLAPTGINTVQTDSGSASPAGGVIQIIGGEGIDTSGATNIITVSGEDATAAATALLANKGISSYDSSDFTVTSGFVELSGTAATQNYVTDSGTASPVANSLNVSGGNGIATTGSGDTVTTDMESPFTGDFNFQSISGGDTEILRISNTSNTASSQAQLRLDVAGTSAGDAFSTFEISGGTSWAFGVDNSDSDRLKISRSTSLGTNDTVYWDSTGQVMPSGFGITFNTSSGTSGTSTTNQLSIFEEGTFTPVISGSVVAGTGTYTIQVGRYQRIGGYVYCTYSIAITAHTGSGTARFSLPFICENISGYIPTVGGVISNNVTGVDDLTSCFAFPSLAFAGMEKDGQTVPYTVENAQRSYQGTVIFKVA